MKKEEEFIQDLSWLYDFQGSAYENIIIIIDFDKEIKNQYK